MRLAKRLILALLLTVFAVLAQYPISMGPDKTAGLGLGVVKFFDWYTGTPTGGCANGANGYCVGVSVQGDSYFFSAWLPNASGLPVTTGLPIVGTINDYAFGSLCSGNIGILQLDTFSWAAPTAAHMTRVNCMSAYGAGSGVSDSPAGWKGHLISSDSSGQGTWKNRVPWSKGGVLYLPVERQISTGQVSVHDATMIMSPDSGAHWCNPYTYANHTGSPGCDSANWSATGDAPLCGASSTSTPCTDTGYLDAPHSSMMWKSLPATSENWVPVQYGNQDGQPAPTGVNDGCDPATYTCFMLQDGSVARAPNASVMDISAWQYYTCPAITLTYRCSGLAAGSWTSTIGSRSIVAYFDLVGSPFQASVPALYSVMYVKEFKSYLMSGIEYLPGHLSVYAWAPAPYGPWTIMHESLVGNGDPRAAFQTFVPALGYTVVSTNPPHVQLGASDNGYGVAAGTPQFSQWDFVMGRNSTGGENFNFSNRTRRSVNAGFQFSAANVAGFLPNKGLVWAFDFLDMGASSGVTNWPYFVDVANGSAVITSSEGFASTTGVWAMNNSHGYDMNNYGIKSVDTGEFLGGHFKVFSYPFTATTLNAPSTFQGNGSYSVVGVYRLDGFTNFSRQGGIWATGVSAAADNRMIAMDQSNGNVMLNWNSPFQPHYQYVSTFSFPGAFTNWYFIGVTVQAQTGCGSNCTPAAHMWVGQSGAIADALAGVSYTNTPSFNAGTKTPNVTAGPFVLGLNQATATGYESSMSYATMLVYNRALTLNEMQQAYVTLKLKLKGRGVTVQ